jgi:hypothetical protein
VNKVFRSVLTGVISVGIFSSLSVAPAQAALNREDVVTAISLTGTPSVGSVLTLTPQTYSFQEAVFGAIWLRCSSPVSQSNKTREIEALLATSTCTEISRSSATTYTLVAADAGKHITVVSYISEQATPPPINDGTSVATSLLIENLSETTTDDATTSGGGTTTGGETTAGDGTKSALPTQKLVKALPAKAKAGKSITIAAVTKSKVAVKVKVAGKGCKVAAVKDKKNKKKIVSYKITMGKPGTSCTVTVTAKATSQLAALKLVKKIKAIK